MGGHVNMMDDVLISNCKSFQTMAPGAQTDSLAEESLTYLIHFTNAIRLAGAQWSDGSELEADLEKFGGDIVQAVQALKESRPEPNEALESQLFKLWTSLDECRAYCESMEPTAPVYPFARSARQVKDVFGLLFPESAHLASLSQSTGSSISVDLSKQGSIEKFALGPHQYQAKEYLEILAELVNITKSHPELVSAIGLCNFDSKHTKEVCDYLLERQGAVGIVSNQIQFSLFDSRPLQEMCAVCQQYNLKLLTYGSFCGGFLSEKWLGQPAPEIYAEKDPLTPSQRKYFDMIRNWGTWPDFQTLLRTLSTIAQKHNVTLTNVATRWVLQQPAVGAVIVGTRLGISLHGDENLKVFGFQLSDGDLAEINEVALGKDGGNSLAVYQALGDCGNEYRAMH
ncbi:hypothetical protein LQW54_008066 [Pestalotiopsis sp. IQ-011]